MSNKLNKLATSFVVMMALAIVGVFFNINSALADEPAAVPKGKEVPAQVGDTVTVTNGDTIVVEAPKAKTTVAVKAATVAEPVPATPKAETAAPAIKVMNDDFSEANKSAEEVDQDSMVEFALRGVLHHSGPAIGATLGFTWRPTNRVRIHAGFDASKGLLELKGEEKELVQFGFTAALTRVMTRTVEFGAFGAMSWSYRDLVKDMSTSFIGVGPGFRLNKAGGLIFFEAAIPIGLGKKFATGDWSLNHALQASLGFHF